MYTTVRTIYSLPNTDSSVGFGYRIRLTISTYSCPQPRPMSCLLAQQGEQTRGARKDREERHTTPTHAEGWQYGATAMLGYACIWYIGQAMLSYARQGEARRLTHPRAAPEHQEASTAPAGDRGAGGGGGGGSRKGCLALSSLDEFRPNT